MIDLYLTLVILLLAATCQYLYRELRFYRLISDLYFKSLSNEQLDELKKLCHESRRKP